MAADKPLHLARAHIQSEKQALIGPASSSLHPPIALSATKWSILRGVGGSVFHVAG
jgi:hypothetical protein